MVKGLLRRARCAWMLVICAGIVSPGAAGSPRPPGSQLSVREALLGLAELRDGDRPRLLLGEVLSRSVDSDVGHETASIHVTRIAVPPAFAVELYPSADMAIETASALEGGSLDGVDRAENLRDLTIADYDLRELAGCSPRRCKVKLPRQWIHRFRREVGWGDDSARTGAERLYRRLLADYAARYRTGGNGALLHYEDKSEPVSVAEQLDGIVASAGPLCAIRPGLCGYLRDPGSGGEAWTTSLRWQTEDVGVRRAVTTLVEQIRVRDDGSPELLVVTKQLYANHYYEGALGVTWIGPTADGTATLVVHALWARIDALRGWSLFRGRIHSGIRDGLAERVAALRSRLEARWASRPEPADR